MVTCKKCNTSWHIGEKGCPFCYAKGKDNLSIEQEHYSFNPEYISQPDQDKRASLTNQRIGMYNGAQRIRGEANSS